jgi:hypothetical protein
LPAQPSRRPDLADATIKAYARTLAHELDRLLKLKPTNAEGRHLRDAIIVDVQDKLRRSAPHAARAVVRV